MSGSVAKAIIIGHLGKDPEGKDVNGNRMVTLSVATSKRWKDKAGERKEKTSWHRVVIYQKGAAEFAEKYLKKGAHVFVEAEIEQREYEKDGEKRTITEFLVSAFNGKVESLEKVAGSGGKPDVPEAGEEDYGEMPY